ncbi:MAG: SBBP repeat-containing protein, partial [Candidatus Thermoplasmatota archaeon]|nr:SBBP repeat-containing protein [Candidatus Thermoplasmatota archaeon]
MSRAHHVCPILIAALLSMTLVPIIRTGSGGDAMLQVPIGTAETASYPDPWFFSENLGQLKNSEVLFTGSSENGAVLFLEDGIILRIPDRAAPVDLFDEGSDRFGSLGCPEDHRETGRSSILKISFNDANEVAPKGREALPFYSNFFFGNDPARWRTGVPNYSEIVYENVWDGADVVYRMGGKGLKYDIILHPGSDHEEVGFRVEGSGVAPGKDGAELEFASGFGPVVYDSGLEVFYQDDPLEHLTSAFKVKDDTYSFQLEGRDPSRTVIIDPLLFSTYLGGSGWEEGGDMDTDDKGCTYLTRFTGSVDFPTIPGSYDETHNGGDWDVFVTKISPSGDSLEYSTFIGGSGSDVGVAVSVDDTGFAYIGGVTGSQDFPTTPGAFDETHDRSDTEVFVLKLGIDGASLQYSTYLGGEKDDTVRGVVADDEGSIFLAGMTESTGLPVTTGSYDQSYNGGVYDVFIAKLSVGGSDLVYCTYLGGLGEDTPFGIDIDGTGCVHIFGETSSKDIPTTEGAFDRDHNGGEMDLFVTKL